MPALKPTEFSAVVSWLGRVEDSTANLRAESLSQADLRFAGIEGDCHAGLTRPSCSRVTAQYPKGTEIRNVRQLSVLSVEELSAIARDMGLDAIDPAWVGASMVIEGMPDFSHVPPSSRLRAPSGACIAIDMENRPCVLPGRVIEAEAPGFGAKFKKAATGRRGVTAWVEAEGRIAVGDRLTLHVPDQPAWSGRAAARA